MGKETSIEVNEDFSLSKTHKLTELYFVTHDGLFPENLKSGKHPAPSCLKIAKLCTHSYIILSFR